MKLSAGFLVVRVRPDGWRRALVLPLPLFVFEEALEAVAALLRLGLRLGLWLRWRPLRPLQSFVSASALIDLVHLPTLMLHGLRSCGPFILAEVTEGRTIVSIRII